MAVTTYGIYTSNRRQTHRRSNVRHAGGAAPAKKLQGYGLGKAPKSSRR